MKFGPVVAALAMAFAACSDTAEPSATTTPRVSVVDATVTATTTAPGPSTTITQPPATTTTTTTPLEDESAGPPAFDTWVAVLASLPAAGIDRADAEEAAEDFGLAQLGVLRSDDYPSLNPGFWVVYYGPVEASWEAASRCLEYGDRAPGCYPRYLGPDPTLPIGSAYGTALGMTDEATLVVVSSDTGEVVRTITDSFGGDGSYPGVPTLSGDGTAAFYTVGYEDYWYSCEASDGDLFRMDLTTGRSSKLADGLDPHVSPHGGQLLYLAASECLPDPAAPELWVLAPMDTVVIRDLATERESRTTFTRPTGAGESWELSSATWSGPDGDSVYVLDNAGSVWHSAGPSPRLVAELDTREWLWDLVGFDSGSLLASRTMWRENSVATELHRIDPTTGDVELAETYDHQAAFAWDPVGGLAVAGPDVATFAGQEVDLMTGITAITW